MIRSKLKAFCFQLCRSHCSWMLHKLFVGTGSNTNLKEKGPGLIFHSEIKSPEFLCRKNAISERFPQSWGKRKSKGCAKGRFSSVILWERIFITWAGEALRLWKNQKHEGLVSFCRASFVESDWAQTFYEPILKIKLGLGLSNRRYVPYWNIL